MSIVDSCTVQLLWSRKPLGKAITVPSIASEEHITVDDEEVNARHNKVGESLFHILEFWGAPLSIYCTGLFGVLGPLVKPKFVMVRSTN